MTRRDGEGQEGSEGPWEDRMGQEGQEGQGETGKVRGLGKKTHEKVS